MDGTDALRADIDDLWHRLGEAGGWRAWTVHGEGRAELWADMGRGPVPVYAHCPHCVLAYCEGRADGEGL